MFCLEARPACHPFSQPAMKPHDLLLLLSCQSTAILTKQSKSEITNDLFRQFDKEIPSDAATRRISGTIFNKTLSPHTAKNLIFSPFIFIPNDRKQSAFAQQEYVPPRSMDTEHYSFVTHEYCVKG